MRLVALAVLLASLMTGCAQPAESAGGTCAAREPGFVLPGRWAMADLADPKAVNGLRTRIRDHLNAEGMSASVDDIVDTTYQCAMLKLDVSDIQVMSYRWSTSRSLSGEAIAAGRGFDARIRQSREITAGLATREYHVQPKAAHDALDIKVAYVGPEAAERIAKYNGIAGTITWAP